MSDVRIGTTNLKWSVGRLLAERALLRMTRHVSAFGAQECRVPSRRQALVALRKVGWDYYQPASPSQARAVPIAWDATVWQVIDKGCEPVAPKSLVEGRIRGRFKNFPDRWLTWVRLEHRETGRRVTIANSHWIPNVDLRGKIRPDRERRVAHHRGQTGAILDWAEGRHHVVALGDTNVVPEHPLLDPFRRAGFLVVFDRHRAARGTHGARVIDQFLTRGLYVVGAYVLPGRLPWDHRPAVVSIRLNQFNKETP